MGLGQAAMEQMSGRSDRAVITNTFSGYYIPTAADMPKVLIVDIVGCEVGPIRSRRHAGGGPSPTAAAINNALDVSFTSLALSPENVLRKYCKL